ncbi:MAG: 2-oxo acid dehydrogenase subunit E2 [Planctomycetaceae bacterium]|nr:2-oxo acid dehydrogenase subunit E2 [Planctomycetaceae bacterium]
MEVPSPHSGTVQKIHIAEGETVKVGQLVLSVETADVAEKPVASTPAPSDRAKSAPENPSPAPDRAAEPAPASEAATGGAVVEFALPNLGEGVETADVADVLVKVGDVVSVDQPVLELETEKAVMEVPCPYAGTIESIGVNSGDQVRVGQNVLSIRTTTATAASKPAKPTAPAQSATPPAATASTAPAVERSTTPARAVQAELVAPEVEGNGHPPIPAAPSTRRLARKLGVELRMVPGSGPGGRITQDDVQSFVRGQLQQRQVPAVARSGGGALAAGSIAPPPLPDFSRFGVIEREPLNKIARTAAENLTVSWNVIPHVTQHDRADITDLEAARKRFGQGMGKNGPKVTMTAIAIKALTTCLQGFPKFNASLDPETNEIVYKRYYNVGCAVDTPNGLLVPVVKDCDKKSILEIAAGINELAEKARDRKLSMDSMQGATCTVTNLGGIGGTAFTPIVNYPEVCILGMARSQKELQLVDGQVTERLMLPLALSYDHRVINGADAARFMATLCQMLSDPFQLLSAI